LKNRSKENLNYRARLSSDNRALSFYCFNEINLSSEFKMGKQLYVIPIVFYNAAENYKTYNGKCRYSY